MQAHSVAAHPGLIGPLPQTSEDETGNATMCTPAVPFACQKPTNTKRHAYRAVGRNTRCTSVSPIHDVVRGGSMATRSNPALLRSFSVPTNPFRKGKTKGDKASSPRQSPAMSRPIPKYGGGFPGGGGGQKWKGKRARPDGGWREGTAVVKWSHAEAMKKKPKVGGEAAVAGDGGGWSREAEAEKEGPDGRSCGRGGFGMSWSEVAMKKAHASTGVGENEWCWPEVEAKKTRPCDKVKGGGGGEVGVEADEEDMYGWRWSEAVSPEILALVLRGRLAADDIARGAAAVCRAWREATAAPDVWGDVDIEAWCRRVNCSLKADAAVRRLVSRAQGTLRRISAYRVGDASLAYVATSGKLLNVLQVPMSEISDQAVEKYAECLPALRVLDISNCLKITSKGMEALGRNCKSLVQLKRNMPPQGINGAPGVVEDEALAVANTMPMLKQLELAYGLFSDVGLGAILTKCPLLQTLDILGSWNVRLEGDIEEKFCALESFREPWEPEYIECSSSGGDDDYDDSESDD